MASSRVRYQEFEMSAHQIKKSPSFYGGFEGFGFGMGRVGMANQNFQGLGFNQGYQSMQVQHQKQNPMFGYPLSANKEKEEYFSVHPHPEAEYKEKIHHADHQESNERYQLDFREPNYTQSFKRVNHFQQKTENKMKEIY